MARSTLTTILIATVVACGGGGEAGATPDPEATPDAGADTEGSAATSASTPTGGSALLCERIEDDEALTPAGAETIDVPGVSEANSERRCLLTLGLDMPVEEARSFYRTGLERLGYEITSDEEMDGIVSGNLSRTFMRAMKSDLQANLTIDEFDTEQTNVSAHRVTVKLQLDAMN